MAREPFDDVPDGIETRNCNSCKFWEGTGDISDTKFEIGICSHELLGRRTPPTSPPENWPKTVAGAGCSDHKFPGEQ